MYCKNELRRIIVQPIMIFETGLERKEKEKLLKYLR